jgi:outer membrane protein, heavy metal efflux system
MRVVALLVLASVLLNAASLGLKEILEKIEHEHPFAKSIQANAYAYEAQNRARSSRQALELSAQGAHATPDFEDPGYEYTVGVEQSFVRLKVKDSALRSAQYQSDAEILNLRRQFLLLKNEVRLLYHTSCLDQTLTQEYTTAYNAFTALFEKKKKAYGYGEISKKEFLHLQIERERIQNELKRYEYEAVVSREKLQSKILLSEFRGRSLLCQDIYDISSVVPKGDTHVSLQEQSLDKQIDSAKSEFNQYDTLFSSFSLSASYQNEIDTDRFIVGMSMPLDFTSASNEEQRAAALHKKSVYEYTKEAYVLQRSSDIQILQKKTDPKQE